MKLLPTPLPDLLLIQLDVHGDERGFFVERYHEEKLAALGLRERFVQDNHSRSAPGVVRGLHWQTAPPMGKLVGVTRGRIWDVAVDVRPGSPTRGKHFAVELSDLGGQLLWIPPGFAHGFCVLGSEPADLLYKCTALYNPQGEHGIRWDDPDLKIPWPVSSPTLSARDRALPSFAEALR
jgi:dTDP-4-dehydrorhamnose 3,5-epimerase